MPRRRLRRRIAKIPKISHFAPIGGIAIPEEIALTVDEFEAMRLKDLEGMDQEKAAKEMNISQPTFHRLILTARKKVADALVNNKIIKIKGGSYEMVTPVTKLMRPTGSAGRGFGRRGLAPAGFCVCPRCGHKTEKVPGIPCNRVMCKKCNTLMVRE